MTPSALTVLWPEIEPPDIEEVKFSFDFCHKVSKRVASSIGFDIRWMPYNGNPCLNEVMPWIHGDSVLHISDPEVVLSPPAIKQLVAGIPERCIACGPVYNESDLPLQSAALPMPYVDMATFVEVSEILAQSEHPRHITVDRLHPACILYRLDFLNSLRGDTLLRDLPARMVGVEQGGLAVLNGALVHLGFNKGFETERTDLVRLIPQGVKTILDIGCARGGYGKLLKRLRPDIRLTGIELNLEMANQARAHYDEVMTCPVEEARFRDTFDLVNCGDILEHLKDPWAMLRWIHTQLNDGGHLVMSIPNAGHWSVARALLKGDFTYIPLGLLCIGHLRWFTEASIKTALQEAGFSIDLFERQEMPPTPAGEVFIRDMCAAGYGDEASLRANEFIIRAGRQGPPMPEPR